jgi:outer membrane biosynthesis protein TonB
VSDWESMRSAMARPVTPLLGSLGLHGGVVLALLIAVRHPAHLPELVRERPDAWAGNAVEVDAVATPEAMPSSPNGEPPAALANAEPSAPGPPAAATPESNAKSGEPSLAHPTPSPPSTPPRPRTPRAPKPEPSEKRVSNASPTADANGEARTALAPGTFGAEGLPPGVRSLPRAFTRAITPATAADPIWQALPVGTQRPFTVAIEVDADGHISGAEILSERAGSAPETQAVHLRERVVALLGGGLFALRNDVGAGRALFRITVTLSDRPVHDDDNPAQLVERGSEAPVGSTPGRAYFTLVSGRHFEARVQVLTRQ